MGLNHGVCHVMKITIAESIPDKGLVTFCFSPDILSGTFTMPIMAMSVASDWDHHDLQLSGPTINDSASSLIGTVMICSILVPPLMTMPVASDRTINDSASSL